MRHLEFVFIVCAIQVCSVVCTPASTTVLLLESMQASANTTSTSTQLLPVIASAPVDITSAHGNAIPPQVVTVQSSTSDTSRQASSSNTYSQLSMVMLTVASAALLIVISVVL
ncbi:hypothetical protein BATDEDRAFT_88202 [Batrachochytrium dendrobatidis JAM81]|uniref:Uncharacterized protein n=2 Tax=Batrachochytrium dendrobatidis TaxID=109871 RepID=F4P142_BATDJ|nr:uncharacterized protein BATDEDRAFT_88202 [Batrachochytrium dendrobatidis JAM81]EGF80986.1 hypothetical protein BATDEDRAFT_88202 [Batrachochytrium dendrobatidis JAM81]KAJ8328924.1 hypothetical protein O5D80_002888 [Batrachochytrium dendrobatidis]KAK5668872.1 hypothetical protein QVD99_004651 [Batrachochytrium dendrobatidis]OAJ41784.1 hypothetical protein BDEG_25328 [Batrachochytrium dendrobatidis JEL423]|eukprot:XP_006678776.1 hypothetical protein BATDEDRAFT_88202 [Batrachochytrium dendrobatidis JAM81]